MRVLPRLTFVRHSPGALTRIVDPTTRRPATTSRRSKPLGGTRVCTIAPQVRNQCWRATVARCSRSS